MARWGRFLIVGAAAAKITLAAVALGASQLAGHPAASGRAWLMFAHVLSFGIAGAILLAGSRRDERAADLGATLLVVAAVFADASLSRHALPIGAACVMALQVDAFTPFLLWRFVLRFPRVADATSWRATLILRATVAIGVLLFVVNAGIGIANALSLTPPAWLAPLSRAADGRAYWLAQFVLALAALVTLVSRIRVSNPDERRRATLLVSGLVLGTAPTILYVIMEMVAPRMREVLPLSIAGWVIYPALLSTPFTTAYAILVRQALDVRLVVRRAIQYALARYSVITVAGVPIVLLSLVVYRDRHKTLVQLFASPTQLALIGAALVGGAALRGRGRVLSTVDRRFFREQYDARHILGELVERCRSARDRAELAAVVRTEVDRALHLETVRVLFLETAQRAFVSPEADVSALADDTALVATLASASSALDVTALAASDGAGARVPAHELHWAVDGGMRLLLPVRDAGQRLVGVLALGDKRSELPFSAEDVTLLERVGAAMAMAMAWLAPEPRVAEPERLAEVAERHAAECVRCGGVQPPDRGACVRCGGETVESVLPQVVGGKFVVDERIGAGGMGVVYRGMDVELGRLVAIKTLPAVSPRDALPLRREARTMAAVSHPNLALIFGAETWQGRPMLVCEYLAGGTLADRLARGPLPADEAITLGLALASVLGAVHRAGILHRDVKPSNIGFTSEGAPKLLDFGLAHILDAIAAAPARDGQHHVGDAAHHSHSSASAVRGTPRYMSPEALAGEPPDASFDLWSLAVVLHEAVTAEHPFPAGASRVGTPPDPRTRVPDLPEPLAHFLRDALSERRADRPRTAAEVEVRLRRARQAPALSR